MQCVQSRGRGRLAEGEICAKYAKKRLNICHVSIFTKRARGRYNTIVKDHCPGWGKYKEDIHHGTAQDRVYVPRLRQEGNAFHVVGQAAAGKMPEEAERRAAFVDREPQV